MNNRFGPGGNNDKNDLRLFMKREVLFQQYGYGYNINQDMGQAASTLCRCIIDETKKKTGIDITLQQETESKRISRLVRTQLGGRTVFGNNGDAILLTSLGGREGQPGGSPRPLRNKF
jgi:hypothetical protein